MCVCVRVCVRVCVCVLNVYILARIIGGPELVHRLVFAAALLQLPVVTAHTHTHTQYVYAYTHTHTHTHTHTNEGVRQRL